MIAAACLVASSTAYGGLILHEFSWVSLAVFVFIGWHTHTLCYSAVDCTRASNHMRFYKRRGRRVRMWCASDDAIQKNPAAAKNSTAKERGEEKSVLGEPPSVRNFSSCVCVFCSYCCRLLFYTLCAGCIAPCATPMAINSETPVIFADTPFSAGKANARDATKRSGQYSSHTSIRKR